MKPGNDGGMIFVRREIPLVIGAAGHRDPELAAYFTGLVQRDEMLRQGQEIVQGMALPGLPQPPNLVDPKEPQLALNPTDSTKAIGHLLASYKDGVLLRSQESAAKRVLIETGHVKPSLKDRVMMTRIGRLLIRE